MSALTTKTETGEIVLTGTGFSVWIDEATAWQIAALVTEVEPTLGADAVVLVEDHPMWDHHSGGDRHSGVPWTVPDAIADARQMRRHLNQLKANGFFELLLSQPGRLFSSEEIVKELPQDFGSPSAVAGCLNGFVKPCSETGHPFPFYWWEGADGKPTRYAVRPSVARVFLAAGG